MNRKLSLSILAGAFAVLFPVAAAAQVAPDKPAKNTDEPVYNWKVYVGGSYTSLNQVNQSRYGLIGGNLAVTRNWGRYFGLTADGSFYSLSAGSGSNGSVTGNPGSPSVDLILAGPEVHLPLLDRWFVFGRALLGGEHTGGENMTPNISFAGGAGGGLEYQISPRFSIRASGDVIAQSFSVINNSSSTAYSPHRTRNSRGGIGIAYRF